MDIKEIRRLRIIMEKHGSEAAIRRRFSMAQIEKEAKNRKAAVHEQPDKVASSNAASASISYFPDSN